MITGKMLIGGAVVLIALVIMGVKIFIINPPDIHWDGDDHHKWWR